MFVCKMYGQKKIKKVNELRSTMFWAKLRKNGKVPDLSLLPPCSSALKKHTARAHYVAKIWKDASKPLQNIDSFIGYGWLEDGNIDWIDAAFPEKLESIFAARDKNEDFVEVEDDENLEEEEEEEEDDEINENNENEL